jgi:hypothetical protein
MHSRVTSVEVDTMRMGMDEALARYRSHVVPRLREQEGYEGVLVLTTPEGKGLLISLWATEQDARRGTGGEGGFYSGALADFMTVFRSPPGREQYEVALADMPTFSTG